MLLKDEAHLYSWEPSFVEWYREWTQRAPWKLESSHYTCSMFSSLTGNFKSLSSSDPSILLAVYLEMYKWLAWFISCYLLKLPIYGHTEGMEIPSIPVYKEASCAFHVHCTCCLSAKVCFLYNSMRFAPAYNLSSFRWKSSRKMKFLRIFKGPGPHFANSFTYFPSYLSSHLDMTISVSLT